ncbi:MAG TPA: hypothetical protein VMX11_09580 [Actinomycetes bacterium]|nr:hypothetical protein [Actinomycetes bacterium]
MTTVCVAGATGWTGRAVAEALSASDDLALPAPSQVGVVRGLDTLLPAH